MWSHTRGALVAAGLIAAAVSTTDAQVNAARLYKLEPASTFQQGCFAPCLCPYLQTAPLRGTFRLELITVGNVFDFYEVSHIRWRALPSNTQAIPIAGDGFYKVSTIAGLQQMAVSLAVGADAVEQFDSAEVPLTAEFPRIRVTISINGGFCHDTVMELHARPTLLLRTENAYVAWDDEPADAGPWSVVWGDLGTLRATGGDFAAATAGCLARGTWDATVPFGADPAPGEAFWLIARRDGDTYGDGTPEQIGDPDAGIEGSNRSCD